MNHEQKNTAPLDDLRVLIKYKRAGLSNEAIAKKMGLSVESVEQRWNDLLVEAASASAGHDDLVLQFNIMAHQYQLLGESLKIMATALANTVSSSQLRELITEDKEDTFQNLIRSCIILHPFLPVNPEESLQKSLKKTTEGN